MSPDQQLTGAAKWLTLLGRRAGGTVRTVVAHAGVLLAVAAVMVYGLGFFRTLASLRTIDVNGLETLSFAPLQTYFIRGVASLLTSSAWFLLVSVVFTTTFAYRSYTEEVHASPPRRRATRTFPRLLVRRGLSLVFVMIGVGAVLFAATSLMPLDGLIWSIFVAAVSIMFGRWVRRKLEDVRAVDPQAALTLKPLVAAAFSLIYVVYVGGATWLDPPPLERARVVLTSGAVASGYLVAQGDGTVYLARYGANESPRPVIAVPTGNIRTMTVRSGVRRSGKTLVDHIGWPSGLTGLNPTSGR